MGDIMSRIETEKSVVGKLWNLNKRYPVNANRQEVKIFSGRFILEMDKSFCPSPIYDIHIFA